MFKITLLTLSLLFSQTAFTSNQADHSENICSEKNASVCAHLKFLSSINTSDEGSFIVHVMTTNDSAISNLKVDLWMDMGSGHGHGSAPVNIATTDEVNHYLITNAWFVMPGTWFVRVSFDYNNEPISLNFPVQVQE